MHEKRIIVQFEEKHTLVSNTSLKPLKYVILIESQ